MKFTGYKAMARLVLKSCEDGDVLSTDDIRSIFDLEERQVQYVKSEARKMAIGRKIFWSFDPEVKGYRVCPVGDRETADRMSAWAVRGAKGALICADWALLGAKSAKLAGARETDLRRVRIAAMISEVEEIAEEIES